MNKVKNSRAYFDNDYQVIDRPEQRVVGIIENRLSGGPIPGTTVYNNGESEWAVGNSIRDEIIMLITFGAIDPDTGRVGFLVNLFAWTEKTFHGYFFESPEHMLDFAKTQYDVYVTKRPLIK